MVDLVADNPYMAVFGSLQHLRQALEMKTRVDSTRWVAGVAQNKLGKKKNGEE